MVTVTIWRTGEHFEVGEMVVALTPSEVWPLNADDLSVSYVTGWVDVPTGVWRIVTTFLDGDVPAMVAEQCRACGVGA